MSVHIEPGITPQAVRNMQEAAQVTSGLFPADLHRHYFLRVKETESVQGSLVTRRYAYKCVCGEEVS